MAKMTTLTIRLPDDTHARLRQLAKQRKMSLNKLIEELATIALTQFEAETRFRARATHGSVVTGLQLLEKLDALTGDELGQR
jgi:predicted transcriptional regulator